jgi:predicted dehydrogenase
MGPHPRRQFLRETTTLAALAALGEGEVRGVTDSEPPASPGDQRSEGPNGTLRVAVIGLRGRGREHIDAFARRKDVVITLLCDVDERLAGPSIEFATDRSGGCRPRFVRDLRRVFDDPDVDAVSIATPNHWHALATIWACQAGKDVYVEKPVSHNVSEGRRMVDAARAYGRIVQTGTQCRSHQGIQDAIAFLRSGGLGQVYMAKGLCYKPRGSIGHQPDGPVPPGVDYDLWLGPAPNRPFNPNRFHYNWHWFWDYGNGDLGNQGIHQMDLARWGLGKSELPKSVQASGGRFGERDDGQTPNTLQVDLEFDDCLLQFEVRGLITNDEAKVRIGNIFYGTEGILAITSYTDWQVYLGPKLEKGPGGSGGGDHFDNFIKAVKSRERGQLTAEIEEGHLSSAYCHLGNIAYRLGRKLDVSPSTESFLHDPEADALLTREYRPPFVVPAKI